MKEHPILMNATNVNAILAGRKTQSRRVIKPMPPEWAKDLVFIPGLNIWRARHPSTPGYPSPAAPRWRCPYGCFNDSLWVRETWAPYDETVLGYALDSAEWVVFRADGKMWNTHTHCYTDRGDLVDPARWRPSIHMPKWATRTWLEIVDVRVERVQDITEEGAQAEGAEWLPVHPGNSTNYIRSFVDLWDSIYAKQGLGWNVNPWIFVITFERIAKS